VKGIFHNNHWNGQLKDDERERHIAHKEQKRWENLKLRDTIKETRTEMVIILKLILETTIQGYELDIIWLGIRT
jgi:hypothetical protein